MRIDVDGNASSFESAALTDHMRRVVEAHRQPSPSSAAHAGSESSVAISPPPSRVRRRLDYNFMRSKEGKKKRGPCQVCVGLPCAGGAAGPPQQLEALLGNAAESRPSALSPSTGLRRDPRASAAFPQRCGSVVDAAPPVFGGASCWRRNSLQPRWKPQTAARASWSARTHETGFVSYYAASHVLLSVKKGCAASIRLRSSAPKKSM